MILLPRSARYNGTRVEYLAHVSLFGGKLRVNSAGKRKKKKMWVNMGGNTYKGRQKRIRASFTVYNNLRVCHTWVSQDLGHGSGP